MKFLVSISRIIVGVLFIFSGLIKANDPRGLSYKMQEFFDVWSQDASLTTFMHWLSNYALPFSIIMITLEIIVGVAILLGTWKNFFSKLLLLLILFFSFLTGYAVLSGKIATCGCFGDCIPLTAMQSFIKDLILLALILIIFFGKKYIVSLLTPAFNFLILLFSCILVLGFQWYVMRHMPRVDCLPFKKGNNILELRKMPADAVPDKKDYKFIYQKAGKKQEFAIQDLPDSTWEFVSRQDYIVQKGKNNEPPIKDFYLTSLSNNDSTEAILNTSAEYYLFFVKDFSENTDKWLSNFTSLYNLAKSKNKGLYIISTQAAEADDFFNKNNHYGLPVLSLDATSFKTAARTSPELYLMKGPLIENKWGWADFKSALK
ncbi:MAG: DoxX family membrane protein [Bacteroidota bacterium]|nr:DoxX family membrane protein [Bacteroidota bacterium]